MYVKDQWDRPEFPPLSLPSPDSVSRRCTPASRRQSRQFPWFCRRSASYCWASAAEKLRHPWDRLIRGAVTTPVPDDVATDAARRPTPHSPHSRPLNPHFSPWLRQGVGLHSNQAPPHLASPPSEPLATTARGTARPLPSGCNSAREAPPRRDHRRANRNCRQRRATRLRNARQILLEKNRFVMQPMLHRIAVGRDQHVHGIAGAQR